MNVLVFETCEQKIKQVTSVGLSLFNYQDDARSNKHKIHVHFIQSCVTSFLDQTLSPRLLFPKTVVPTSARMLTDQTPRIHKTAGKTDFWVFQSLLLYTGDEMMYDSELNCTCRI